jgi:hypothetical protein
MRKFAENRLSSPAFLVRMIFIDLRIYSHWVPGTRRVTTSGLDTASANNRQMLDENGKEKEAETTVNR